MTWVKHDEEVPKGTVGIVMGCKEPVTGHGGTFSRAVVQWPRGTFSIKIEELRKCEGSGEVDVLKPNPNRP